MLFSFRKIFWKTDKNNWRARIKQKKALEKHGKQLVKYSDEKEYSKNSKQKIFFEELASNRMKEIQDLSKQINFYNLTYKS